MTHLLRPTTVLFPPEVSEAYFWHCNSDAALSVITQIRPYLVIKTVQADLAIDTQKRLRVPALKADRTWQQEHRLQMKELNRRGGVPVETE